MADRSGIEWTDATLNPIRARNPATGRIGWHCAHASEGCRGCYAEAFNRRLGTGLPYIRRSPAELFLDERMLAKLSEWKRPRLIFVGSMTDLFARFVRPEWLDAIFAAASATPRHTIQLLTKRPGAALAYLRGRAARGLPVVSNVWVGTSAEKQAWLDGRGASMAAIGALGWHTWLSAEPLLGPMSIEAASWIEWLVVGGESGPRARMALPGWVDQLRQECAARAIPFFFKQWGAWRPREAGEHDQGDLVRYLDVAACGAAGMQRVGKRSAGAHLHGRIWQAFPAEMQRVP